jgi:tagatose-1,6-bisphosphate aldolase non-catalytic subunit AgaZ/GatZ
MDIVDYKMNLLSKLKDAYDKIIEKREDSMHYYKSRYDSKQKVIQFKLGDLVMVYWPVPKAGLSQKLLPRWDGPFEVVEQIGKWSYRIKKKNKLFSIHVQRMRKYQPLTD